jgi:CheY-like chemotaxis protein
VYGIVTQSGGTVHIDSMSGQGTTFRYQVLVAALPSEAIAIAAGCAGEIEVLLTDVVMPEMSGRELCEALTASRPTMRTLYMSGYTDEALGHHGVLGERFALIDKPFTAAALARKLREIVEGDKNNTIGHELGHA